MDFDFLDIAAPARPAVPMLQLGQLNATLAAAAVRVSEAGLASLGIHPAGRDSSARLYRECDVPDICAVLALHLLQIRAQLTAPRPPEADSRPAGA